MKKNKKVLLIIIATLVVLLLLPLVFIYLISFLLWLFPSWNGIYTLGSNFYAIEVNSHCWWLVYSEKKVREQYDYRLFSEAYSDEEISINLEGLLYNETYIAAEGQCQYWSTPVPFDTNYYLINKLKFDSLIAMGNSHDSAFTCSVTCLRDKKEYETILNNMHWRTPK